MKVLAIFSEKLDRISNLGRFGPLLSVNFHRRLVGIYNTTRWGAVEDRAQKSGQLEVGATQCTSNQICRGRVTL